MPNVADFADLAAAFRAARGENRPPRVYRPAAGARGRRADTSVRALLGPLQEGRRAFQRCKNQLTRSSVSPSSGRRRYVVGVVEDRGAEGYRVALPGAAVGGVLPALAFDGATKRNRPRLEIGDAVYCRVPAAERESCPRGPGFALSFKRAAAPPRPATWIFLC